MDFNKKYLFDYLKLVIPAIIIFGVLKLSVFYSAFNINILNFLDFDEILTLSLSDVILISIFFLISFLYGTIQFEENDINRINKIQKEYIEKISFKKLLLFLLNSWETPFIAILSIFLTIIHFTKKYNNFTGGFKLFLYFLLALLFFDFVLLEVERNIKNKYTKEIPHSSFGFLSLIGYFLIITTLIGNFEVYSIKKSKNDRDVKFKISNVLIECNDTQYYIGKTRNYLFCYLEKTSETKIYPMKNIEMLSFSKSKEKR